jgi:hypothetical protein
MTLRYDSLSELIGSYNNQLNYINQMLLQLDATITAIQANGAYAAQTSSGTKTILTNTHNGITASNAAMLSVPSE